VTDYETLCIVRVVEQATRRMNDMTEPAQPSNDDHPGMPPWLKLSALVVAVAVVALIVVMLAIGGEHGPGRHAGAVAWR